MKTLKCKSCGGELVMDEKKEYATCPYCKLKVKLNDTHTINIKIDDSLKEFVKPPKWIIIPIVIVFTIILIGFFMIFKNINDTQLDIGQKPISINKNMHNKNFEPYSGTKEKIFIERLLDNVITNNKTNQELIISVKYKGQETQDSTEIIKIKHNLENKQYEVILDYNEEGYVTKISIDDI